MTDHTSDDEADDTERIVEALEQLTSEVKGVKNELQLRRLQREEGNRHWQQSGDEETTIQTGSSEEQRERVKGIKEIIRDLQERHDGEPGAPEHLVIYEAVRAGIDEETAEHEIWKLRDKGEIYSPDQNHLRLV